MAGPRGLEPTASGVTDRIKLLMKTLNYLFFVSSIDTIIFIEFKLLILWDTCETLQCGNSCIGMPEVHKCRKYLIS